MLGELEQKSCPLSQCSNEVPLVVAAPLGLQIGFGYRHWLLNEACILIAMTAHSKNVYFGQEKLAFLRLNLKVAFIAW